MVRPLRFGVINETLAPRAAWFDGVRRAEAEGYATFLIRDHLVDDFFGEQFSPFVALAAAAAVTEALRLGTMVAAVDFRHPAFLAKEVATLDALSGGRAELGLGAGWLQKEYEQAGLPYAPAGERVGRLEEAVQVVRGLWAGGPLTFEGRHYQVRGLSAAPLPVQRPGPPVLLGGGHRRVLTMAGRLADSVGVLTTSVATGTVVEDPQERMPAAAHQKLAWVREGAAGRAAPPELSLIPTLIVADRRREAAEQWLARKGWAGLSAEDVFAMPSVLVGSLEQIAEDVRRRREEYGFSYYIFSDRQAAEAAPLVAALAGA